MTPEKFLLNFYDVKQAGLYLPENASSRMADRFSNKELWDLFGKWYAKQTTFAATATYEKELYSDIERTFCYAFHGCADGSFILVTWNEHTTNRQGKILSVAENANPMLPTVTENQVQPNQVPGVPSYFWIIPSKNIIATIKPKWASLTGVENLRRYMENFLQMPLPGMSFEKCPNTGNFTYSFDNDGGQPIVLVPKFKIIPKRSKTDIEHLLTRYSDVRKIVSKRAIDTTKLPPDSSKFMDNLKSFLTLNYFKSVENHFDGNRQIHWKLETEFRPNNPEELKCLVDNWQFDEDYRMIDEENLGFVLQGDSTPVWVKGSMSRIKDLPGIPTYTDDSKNILDPRWIEKFLLENRQMIEATLAS